MHSRTRRSASFPRHHPALTLNFLADESCDFRVVRALRENGHDVLAVCEFAKRIQDSDVIDLSKREDRILITEDKDFGQLVYAHGHGSRGVILLRYPAFARRRLSNDVVRTVEQKKEALLSSFAVLQPGRLRVTRLPHGG
jgi:predicted nuclease of predicted toxin-antitoxin system